jgi:hypothetical protein
MADTDDQAAENHGPSGWGKALRYWFGRCVKAGLAVVLTVLAVVFGFKLNPPKPLAKDIVQPTVTIYASQPDVSAVVTLSAYPYRARKRTARRGTASTGTASAGTASAGTGRSATSAPPKPGYEFDITIKVLSPRTSTVTFVLLLSDFPRILSPGITGLKALSALPATAASEELPVPTQDARGHADDLAIRTFVPSPSGALARTKRPSEPTVMIATKYSVVSRSSGSELQVAFPVVQDEKPGPPLPPSISIASLLGAYEQPSAYLSGSPVSYYEPNVEAGDIQYRPANGTNLADYQTLAGTTPVIRPAGAWSWAGISDVSLIAQNALTADVDQEHLFWDGVAWGVAGAGGIAAVLEIVSAIQGPEEARTRKRRRRAGGAESNAEVAPEPAAS